MSVKRLALKDALMVARKSEITKSTLPVLNNVVLSGNTLKATDLNVVVEAKLDGELSVHDRLVPQDKLYKILQKHNSIDDVTVRGQANADRVTINDRFEAESLDVGDYPEVPGIEDVHGRLVLSGEQAKRLFDLADEFSGADDSRSYLDGALLDGGRGYMVATDGARLVRKEIPEVELYVDPLDVAEEADDGQWFWPLMGKGFVKIVDYALGKAKVADDAEIVLQFDGDLVEVRFDGTRRGTEYRILGRRVKEEFPKYWQVIPNRQNGGLGYRVDELEEELKTIKEVAATGNNHRVIIKEDGTLRSDGGRDDLDYEYRPEVWPDGERPEAIHFNAESLYSIVRRLNDEKMVLRLIGGDAPGVIVEDDELFLIMPLRQS